MRLLLLLTLLLTVLVLVSAAADNSTKPAKKTLRMVKRLKRIKKHRKNSTKIKDETKMASYHVPIVVSSEDMSHVPVKLELHDDDRYLKSSADLHPIEPIHLVNVDGTYHPHHHQQVHPVYVESKDPVYGTYPAGGSHSEPVYQGPVATPAEYPVESYESENSHSHKTSGISPHEYYPDNYGDLSAIPGSAGIDYPTYAYPPKTGFQCLAHTSTPGFYADVETKCQMWHYCQPDGRHDRFLCPNGTVFDQLTRVCNWWFNVHCDDSLSLYDINFDLYREPLKTPSQSLDIVPYRKIPSQPQDVPPYHQSSSESVDVSPYHQSPSQTLDPSHHHHHSSPSSHPHNSAPNPNSFLRHVKDFEANIQSHHRPDNYRGNSDKIHYNKPIHSAANPRPVHRYPSKIAPAPKVVHEYDHNAGLIDYDSSNAHTQLTPSDDIKLPYSEPKSKPRKKIARRKLRRHPKIYAKKSEDDIPTYREGKATPPPSASSRKYRIVRRRKINKD